MKPFLFLFCLSAFTACLTPVRADLQLIFNVTQKTETAEGVTKKNPLTDSSKEFILTVDLGEDYLASAAPDIVVAHDFKNKRSYRLNLLQKTYHEQSLYADIGFRKAELHNRMAIKSAFSAGQVKENPFDTVLIEHLFALRSREYKALSPATAGEGLSYTHGEQPLFSGKGVGKSLTPEEMKQFIRFLRYAYSAHPDILAALEEKNTVPAEFTLHHYNMKADHYHFTLVNSATVTRRFDPSTLVDGFKRMDSEIDSIRELADKITREGFKEKCDELARAAIVEGEQKRYLECLLIFLEYVLSSGQPLPQEFQTFRAELQEDPKVKAFFAAINPKDKEGAQEAAEVVRNLRTGTNKGAAVLKIHEANNLTRAGKMDEARELFKEALAESPWIVGAWKDFGDLYYSAYDMGTAWQCWDTGRRLHPLQKQFVPVGQFERKLLKDHPEFF